VANDEAVALQPPKRHIDLAGIQRRQQFPEPLLQRLLQLVPVSAPAAQQREKELPHE
jgi:hypothetical protein